MEIMEPETLASSGEHYVTRTGNEIDECMHDTDPRYKAIMNYMAVLWFKLTGLGEEGKIEISPEDVALSEAAALIVYTPFGEFWMDQHPEFVEKVKETGSAVYALEHLLKQEDFKLPTMADLESMQNMVKNNQSASMELNKIDEQHEAAFIEKVVESAETDGYSDRILYGTVKMFAGDVDPIIQSLSGFDNCTIIGSEEELYAKSGQFILKPYFGIIIRFTYKLTNDDALSASTIVRELAAKLSSKDPFMIMIEAALRDGEDIRTFDLVAENDNDVFRIVKEDAQAFKNDTLGEYKFYARYKACMTDY